MSLATPRLPLGPVFSWYRVHGGLVYTSGHAAVDVASLRMTQGDIREETRLTLENLARTLQAAGSSMDKVLKVTAFLTDMSDFKDFNEVYARFFGGDEPPARTCVEVSRLPYNFRIEIEAVAAL